MATVKSGRMSFRRMEEEMKVGIRLHKRLLGQNDVLDHELNYKVNRMTKEQKKAFSQLDSDMKYLKQELSKNSIKQRFNGEKSTEKSSGIHYWDKPSPTVLKARMMLQTTKTTKDKNNDDSKGRILHKLMPKNVIRLEDLPRLKYEEKRRSSTARSKISVTNGEMNTGINQEVSELFPPSVLPTRRCSVPILPITSFEDLDAKHRHYRRNSNKSETSFSPENFLSDEPCSYREFRRSSILSDTKLLDVQRKISSHSERRKSFPNTFVDVGMTRRSSSESRLYPNKNSDDFVDTKVKCNTPSHTERRIQRKRSAMFQIYKYLADTIPNMSNQTLADIHRERQKKLEEREALDGQ